MSNEEIIKRVNAWQSAGFIHPLTCRWSSKHELLVPVEKNGKVILKCPSCKGEQLNIPPSIINIDPTLIEQEKQKLIKMVAKF